jgi:hypothetical protein
VEPVIGKLIRRDAMVSQHQIVKASQAIWRSVMVGVEWMTADEAA